MRRRRFLAATSALALTATVSSWRIALGQSALSDGQTAALLRMVRDIFPHDALDDTPYQAVVAQISGAAADAGTYEMISSGLMALDEATGGSWATQDEPTRVKALTEMQTTPFFITVRAMSLFGLYANPAIWPTFGYEGESYSQGGYLFRGFDDVGWLPEPAS